MKLRCLTLSLALAGAGPAWAAAPLEFNRDIRPILSENCFNCHGGDAASRKGGLRLDERDTALRGGKSGAPAIVPGKSDESELLLRARDGFAADARRDLSPP